MVEDNYTKKREINSKVRKNESISVNSERIQRKGKHT